MNGDLFTNLWGKLQILPGRVSELGPFLHAVKIRVRSIIHSEQLKAE